MCETGGVRPLRAEEEWAREIIAHALGVPVVQHDDGSRERMHDLDILLGNGVRAAVEVTAAADGEAIALWNLLNGRGARWIEPTLVGGWLVTLAPSARAKRVRQELPALLQALEASGVREVRTLGDSTSGVALAARLLDVVAMRQSDTQYPGSIYITLELPIERTGGFVAATGDALAEWAGDFLRDDERADVRDKLRRSAAHERHAVLIVPGFTVARFGVVDLLMRDDAPLPEADPALPAEVTHVWALSTWSTGRGMRWSPDQGWSLFDKRSIAAA